MAFPDVCGRLPVDWQDVVSCTQCVLLSAHIPLLEVASSGGHHAVIVRRQGCQLCTSVPIGSPSITFFRLPTMSMLNTYIGRLFSLHMVVAVRSITFKPRV